MKIIHKDSGEALQLNPDTKLSIERTNPFFNEYGEQSVPVDIPASDHNCRLLGHPEAFGIRKRTMMSDAVIQDGEYYAQCRQAVLSARRHGTISTSFYMNDGSFYSRLENAKLRDIYGTERITAAGSTVASCIAWCKTLINNTDPDYTIFPVLVTDDSGLDTGWNYKILNNWGTMRLLSSSGSKDSPSTYQEHQTHWPLFGSSGGSFEGEKARDEYVNEVAVALTPGYYISPFVRARRVLTDLFTHFGYTLQPNFFTQTEPFASMAIVNNCIDTLVNGFILKADLVPDISCKDFLAVFRKKFCCEFEADEATRTVSVRFLKDIVDAAPSADLTHRMTAEPTFAYKAQKDYKRVKLTAEHHVNSDTSGYDTLKELLKDNDAAWFNKVTGAFYKYGYTGGQSLPAKVAESSMDYDTGDVEETFEVKVPEQQPEYRNTAYTYEWDEELRTKDGPELLYIGDYTARHSRLKITSAGSDDAENDTDKTVQCPCMLAFCYKDPASFLGCAGSISAYNLLYHYYVGDGSMYDGMSDNRSAAFLAGYGTQIVGIPRLWDYSLFYWGPDGIFENFYRPMDDLQRNTLNEVKVKLLLTDHEKISIPPTSKVSIRSVPFLLDKLKFVIGGKDEPLETQLRTLAMAADSVTAKTVERMMPYQMTAYHWASYMIQEEVTYRQIRSIIPSHDNGEPDYPEGELKTVYPPTPTADMVGQRFGEQTVWQFRDKTAWSQIDGGGVIDWCRDWHYYRITYYLLCE